jgi:hypothetical protein
MSWFFLSQRRSSSLTVERPRCRLARLLLASPLLLLPLAGCGTGETDDACWSDFDCSSHSCTFGTCDSALLGLLELLADASRASNPPSPPSSPAQPRQPYCGSHDEATCQATPGCTVTSLCSISYECALQPQTPIDTCIACLNVPGCPSPCQLVEYCH